MASSPDAPEPTWCDGCTYVAHGLGKIAELQEANRATADAAYWVEDRNIAARERRALGEFADDAKFEQLVCDPTTGCRFAIYCINRAIESKQREPFRRF